LDNHQLKRKSERKCFCAVKTSQFFEERTIAVLILTVFTIFHSSILFSCFVIKCMCTANTWASMNFRFKLYLILTLFGRIWGKNDKKKFILTSLIGGWIYYVDFHNTRYFTYPPIDFSFRMLLVAVVIS
jgi:hypothetical protein